ncbi:MAG: glycosyltransferase family 2 protein [Pseudomonadota bacterium]
MSDRDQSRTPAFAIVIPMKDEAGNVEALLDGCVAAATPLGPFEIWVTDDGSTDGTGEVLRGFQRAHPDVMFGIVTHARSAGQSAAVHSAVGRARAPLICTLDGDGQNPPDQIPRLLAPFEGGDAELGLVAGQRARRQDTLAKRWASRFANRLRGWLLKDGTRDTGCGLKAFRREPFLALPYFDHMHRYLPALFQRDGWRVAHVDVEHQERGAGRSKYTNFGRALVGVSDLMGVVWLIRRKKRVGPGDISVTEIRTETARADP